MHIFLSYFYRTLLNQSESKRREEETKAVESQKIMDSLSETLQNKLRLKEAEFQDHQNSLKIFEDENIKLRERNDYLLKQLTLKTDEENYGHQDLRKVMDSNNKLQNTVDEVQKQLR